MMRVRRDVRASKTCEQVGGAGYSVVPNRTTNRFLQYPALEALGYNTSPLRGCSPFRYRKIGFTLEFAKEPSRRAAKMAQLGAVFKLLRPLCMSLKRSDLSTL